jgi:hypothetical protein
MKIKRLASLTLLIITLLIVSPTYAQSTTPTPPASPATATANCDFDLSRVSALLTQAQAKGTGGDLPGATALLREIRTLIAEIEARCGSTIPGDFKLTQEFIDPLDKYKLNYPEDWLTSSLNDSGAAVNSFLFASNQAGLDLITKGTKTTSEFQGVVVTLGKPDEVARQLGSFNDKTDYASMNTRALLQAVTASPGNASGGTFKAIQPSIVGGREAFEAQFVSTSNDVQFDGLIVIVKVSDTQFAALVGVTNPGKGAQIEALTRAIAATVQLH